MNEPAPTVFFVTGFHKSGTTWTMRLLGSLPKVLCLGEGRFFASELEELPSLYEGLEHGLRDWHRFQAHRKGNWLENETCVQTLHRQNVVDEEAYRSLFERDLSRLVRGATVDFLYARAAKEPSVTHVGDKTPVTSAEQLRRIRRVFPEAPIVVLERDVREVVVSLALHHWRSRRDMRPDRNIRLLDESDYLHTDRFQRGEAPDEGVLPPRTAARIARRWSETRAEARRLLDESPDRTRILAYADLLAEPADALHATADFLGVSADESELLTAVETNSRTALAVTGGPGAEHARSHTQNAEAALGPRALEAIGEATA